jgi:hypothetical protein
MQTARKFINGYAKNRNNALHVVNLYHKIKLKKEQFLKRAVPFGTVS